MTGVPEHFVDTLRLIRDQVHFVVTNGERWNRERTDCPSVDIEQDRILLKEIDDAISAAPNLDIVDYTKRVGAIFERAREAAAYNDGR